jgi:phage terminase large subunit-like protein
MGAKGEVPAGCREQAQQAHQGRAKHVSAQCEVGNVKIVRAPWNDDFLRGLEGLPIAKHEDQVDAPSGAHRRDAGLIPLCGDGRSVPAEPDSGL